MSICWKQLYQTMGLWQYPHIFQRNPNPMVFTINPWFIDGIPMNFHGESHTTTAPLDSLDSLDSLDHLNGSRGIAQHSRKCCSLRGKQLLLEWDRGYHGIVGMTGMKKWDFAEFEVAILCKLFRLGIQGRWLNPVDQWLLWGKRDFRPWYLWYLTEMVQFYHVASETRCRWFTRVTRAFAPWH